MAARCVRPFVGMEQDITVQGVTKNRIMNSHVGIIGH
jgi:hypothetical protein